MTEPTDRPAGWYWVRLDEDSGWVVRKHDGESDRAFRTWPLDDDADDLVAIVETVPVLEIGPRILEPGSIEAQVQEQAEQIYGESITVPSDLDNGEGAQPYTAEVLIDEKAAAAVQRVQDDDRLRNGLAKQGIKASVVEQGSACLGSISLQQLQELADYMGVEDIEVTGDSEHHGVTVYLD